VKFEDIKRFTNTYNGIIKLDQFN